MVSWYLLINVHSRWIQRDTEHFNPKHLGPNESRSPKQQQGHNAAWGPGCQHESQFARVPDSLLAKFEKYKAVKYTFVAFFFSKRNIILEKRFTVDISPSFFSRFNLSTCPTFLFHDKGQILFFHRAVWVELLGTNQTMVGTSQLYGGIKCICLESIISIFWINKNCPVFEKNKFNHFEIFITLVPSTISFEILILLITNGSFCPPHNWPKKNNPKMPFPGSQWPNELCFL